MLTIGQLAKQVGLRTSALRYYEQEGLLIPNGRSDSGYRLYGTTAVTRLRFIQRAQRLGFSLSDIRTLLDGWDHGDLSNAQLLTTTENRYIALEKQITELLVQRHELSLFLQDLEVQQQHDAADTPSPDAFGLLLEQVCLNPDQQTPDSMLEWLMVKTGCNLTSETGQQIVTRLQGQHFHIWQEAETYCVLVVASGEDQDGGVNPVASALQQLAQLEANCHIHPHLTTELIYNDEGYLFKASGPHAFIFARLFLSLETAS